MTRGYAMATGSPSHKRIEIPKKSDIVYEGYAKFKSKTKVIWCDCLHIVCIMVNQAS